MGCARKPEVIKIHTQDSKTWGIQVDWSCVRKDFRTNILSEILSQYLSRTLHWSEYIDVVTMKLDRILTANPTITAADWLSEITANWLEL